MANVSAAYPRNGSRGPRTNATRHASNAGSLAIAANRVAQTVIHRLRIQQGVDERFAIADGKGDLTVFLDRASGRVLHTRQHEIGHGSPLQSGCALDKILLLRGDTSLQTFGRVRPLLDLDAALGMAILLANNVRPTAGHSKAHDPSSDCPQLGRTHRKFIRLIGSQWPADWNSTDSFCGPPGCAKTTYSEGKLVA